MRLLGSVKAAYGGEVRGFPVRLVDLEWLLATHPNRPFVPSPDVRVGRIQVRHGARFSAVAKGMVERWEPNEDGWKLC